MDNYLSNDNSVSEQDQVNASIYLNKEYVWKNIFKIEALRKENSLRKTKNFCKNIQVNLENKL